MANFRTIHTTYGLTRIAQAEATGKSINLVAIAVGDGGGNPVTPVESQQALVRERFRAAPNRVFQDPSDPRMFNAELVIPANVGGWTMREIGVFDDQGSLFAVGNLPDTYKPTQGEGAYSDATIRLQFLVRNASVISVMIDPTVTMATRQWTYNTFSEMVTIPGGTTGQVLSKETNADGDYIWVDPTEANVTVRSIEEIQTLAANQTTVDLTKTTTTGLSVYIEGVRLRPTDQWTKTTATRLTLSTSYPAGTKIALVQNDPNGAFFDPLLRSNNLSDVADKAAARTNLDTYSKGEVDSLLTRMPAGSVVYFAGLTPPSGWFRANGAAVSRTAYADLFAAIGTLYGAGDGFTTFNLPDLRGEFIRCMDDGRGIDSGRGIGTFQDSQNKAHTHAAKSSTAGAHSHVYSDADTYLTNTSGLAGGNNFTDRDTLYNTSTNGDHSHVITVDPSGGTEARPRNVAQLALIKF